MFYDMIFQPIWFDGRVVMVITIEDTTIWRHLCRLFSYG